MVIHVLVGLVPYVFLQIATADLSLKKAALEPVSLQRSEVGLRLGVTRRRQPRKR
jgi:hypothetical protein